MIKTLLNGLLCSLMVLLCVQAVAQSESVPTEEPVVDQSMAEEQNRESAQQTEDTPVENAGTPAEQNDETHTEKTDAQADEADEAIRTDEILETPYAGDGDVPESAKEDEPEPIEVLEPNEDDVDEEPVEVVDPSCVQFEHGWQEGDVSRDKKTRLDIGVFSEYAGKTIRKIRFNTIDVFDETNPEENNALYRFMNTLHVNTKTHVIQSQLLFKEGDKVNRKAIQESARILRTRNYLTNAYILPDAVCDTQIDILVVTQDAWSLEPEVSFSQKADDSESGFALSDDNILGTGNSVVVGYEQSIDRNSIYYSFSNPHFLNKPISVKASFAETSDGDNKLLNVSRPFYSITTPWATGVLLEDISEVSTIRSGGDEINEYRHQHEVQEVFFGVATNINDEYTNRWLVGITKEDDTFYEVEDTVLGIPEARGAAYPWIGYQYANNSFGVFKNVNQIQRAEDIPLGLNVETRLGYGATSFDSSEELVRYKAKITNTTDMRDDHILELRADLDGRYHLDPGYQDSTVVGGEIAYNYFINSNNRWYVRARYDWGEDLLQHEQLTAGDITGMRGYPTDYQRGEQRYIFTIERRYFSDYHLFNLVRMGGVLFFDTGRAWGDKDGVPNPQLANVGLGLRLSSTKVRVGNVVHINIASPLTHNEGISDFQLLVSAQQRF